MLNESYHAIDEGVLIEHRQYDIYISQAKSSTRHQLSIKLTVKTAIATTAITNPLDERMLSSHGEERVVSMSASILSSLLRLYWGLCTECVKYI